MKRAQVTCSVRMDRMLCEMITLPSFARWAFRLAASSVCLLASTGLLHCAMGDTGAIDFATGNSTKGKNPPRPCAGDGECAPPKPYCDVGSATCIECLADPNCTGPKHFCGPFGACVECVGDEGCSKG